MLHRLTLTASLAVLLSLTPVGAQAGAVELIVGNNTTCPVNNCVPGALSFGQSVSKTFTFSVVDGADTYSVTGDYSNSFTSGTEIMADLTATYTGTAPSTTTDTFTVDVLQNFSDSDPGTWDGLYTESVAGTLGTGTILSTNLIYTGTYNGNTPQPVGVIGPITGPGSYNRSLDTNLAGLDGAVLQAAFLFTFTFDAGDPHGTAAVISEPTAAPEPAETIPAALFLIAGTCWMRTRRVRP